MLAPTLFAHRYIAFRPPGVDSSHHPRSPMTQEDVLELARARTAEPE